MAKVQPTTEHDVAAPSRRSLVLKGHDSVHCLAALDNGRLASYCYDQWSDFRDAPDDKSIVIWSVADGTQLAKLEGHTSWVTSLAALDGGRLASGSWDRTIRVRPVLHSGAYKFATCGSAFEFEEVARTCCEQDCLPRIFF